MSIRIQITSEAVENRSVTQKATGRQFQFKEQTAWAFTCDQHGNPHPHPEKITVTLPRGQETPYPVGDYTLHPASFYVGNFGSLNLSPRLVPVKSRS
jgi:hypothetical protein